VGEFNEGVRIDFQAFSGVTKVILEHFGNREFGFIANRTKTYSLDLNIFQI